MLIKYLLQKVDTLITFLKTCLKIINRRTQNLNAKKIYKLYIIACKHMGLIKPESPMKHISISDMTKSNLPFVKGFIRNKKNKKTFLKKFQSADL